MVDESCINAPEYAIMQFRRSDGGFRCSVAFGVSIVGYEERNVLERQFSAGSLKHSSRPTISRELGVAKTTGYLKTRDEIDNLATVHRHADTRQGQPGRRSADVQEAFGKSVSGQVSHNLGCRFHGI